MAPISRGSLALAGMALLASAAVGASTKQRGDGASAMTAQPAMNWQDRRDFDFAGRGFIGTAADRQIRDDKGNVAYDLDAFAFLDAAEAKTIHPSLLRQQRLFRRHGLFKVVDGVYQVRGFDVTNITFVRGRTGWIVIDPALTPAVARAAHALVTRHLGDRPIVALIYTHSHVDHFGGAAGVVDQQDVDDGRVEVIAPAGFMAATLSEFLINGAANQRRIDYAGPPLKPGPEGYVGIGLAPGSARGPISLVPPTVEINRTGEEREVDGVRLVFQMTPGTEAPAEFNIHLPGFRVLHMAENANGTMHNILSPRGVEVRDARAWAAGLTDAIGLFGPASDAVIVSHGWPRFGQAEVVDYLSKHRDAYKYLHDQTVRMMNDGLLPEEIANRLRLPESLEREWYNHGYYGSFSFNVRAIYQRYLGWYDGNPVNLAPFEPAEESRRYVDAMGGRDAVLASARDAAGRGDDRWATQLLNRLVMMNAADRDARQMAAECYERMAYAQENAIWRNQYLVAALELRDGIAPAGAASLNEGPVLSRVPTAALFDLAAVRLDPAKTANQTAVIDFIVPDRKDHVRVSVRNDVLNWQADPAPAKTDASVTLTRPQLLQLLLAGRVDPAVAITGSADSVRRFAQWFTSPDTRFPIMWRK